MASGRGKGLEEAYRPAGGLTAREVLALPPEERALVLQQAAERMAAESPDEPVVASQASLQLSVKVQQGLSAMQFEDSVTALLAQLAGVELANSTSQKARLDWFDRCRSLAKEGRRPRTAVDNTPEAVAAKYRKARD